MKSNKLLILVMAVLTVLSLLPASTQAARASSSGAGGMELHRESEMDYWLYTPSGARENSPLIVYLHGVTGKGDDPNLLLEIEEFPKYLADGALGEVPAYVLIPQLASEKKDWASETERVADLIKTVMSDYPIERENVSLTGFSMGGAGVWSIAVSHPELFRRIAPCSGGLRSSDTALSALSKLDLWAFVGTADTVVKPQATVAFVEQLRRVNPNASITQIEGAAHTDMPALVYRNDEIDLVSWLIGVNGASAVSTQMARASSGDDDGNGNGDGSLMYQNSDFVEKEQPEITEETKRLIAAYQKDPSEANYLALRDEVIKNHNAVPCKKGSQAE